MFRTIPSLALMLLFAGVAPAHQFYYPYSGWPGHYRVSHVHPYAPDYGFLVTDSPMVIIGPTGAAAGLPYVYPFGAVPHSYYSYLPILYRDPTVVPFNYGPLVTRDMFLSEVAFAWAPASYPAANAVPAETDSTAHVTLTVPADAEVLFQGQPIQQTGAVRTIVTPQLGGPGTYELKVKWTENGKTVERPVSVELKPGDWSSVTILR